MYEIYSNIEWNCKINEIVSKKACIIKNCNVDLYFRM